MSEIRNYLVANISFWSSEDCVIKLSFEQEKENENFHNRNTFRDINKIISWKVLPIKSRVLFFEFEREWREKLPRFFFSPWKRRGRKGRGGKKKILVTLSLAKEIWVKWKRLLLFPIMEKCKGGCKPFSPVDVDKAGRKRCYPFLFSIIVRGLSFERIARICLLTRNWEGKLSSIHPFEIEARSIDEKEGIEEESKKTRERLIREWSLHYERIC